MRREHWTRLARVKIHVERVIGHMKNKYTLLERPILFSINLLKHKEDSDELCNIDIVLMCCTY